MDDTNIKSISTEKYTPLVSFTQIFFVLLWSSGAIVIEFGFRYVTPFTFLFYRFFFAIIFMCIVVFTTKATWPRDWITIKKTMLTGLLTQFVYITAYFFALYKGVSPTVMTILLGLQPILTAVIYNLIFKDKVKFLQYAGLILGLLGVFFSVMYDFKSHAITLLGFFYAVICVLAITTGSVVQKSNPKMDLRTGSLIQFCVSIIPIAVLNIFFGSFHFPVVPGFLLPLIWMALVVSVSATCLYYKLLRDGSAVAVNSLFYLVPVITAILCYFIFGTSITIYLGLGIIFILLGVFITQKNS